MRQNRPKISLFDIFFKLNTPLVIFRCSVVRFEVEYCEREDLEELTFSGKFIHVVQVYDIVMP